MRATVCLPTYDERANLEPMLRALAGVLRDGDRVLVIDDNSPDGTGELADRARRGARRSSRCSTGRSKEGLGPAYLAGFERALADGAELVLEMDCDFSHDPADVPRLIAAVENGADLAIGSRYVTGGQVGNWGLCAARSRAAARSTPRSSCGSGSRTRPPASSASGAPCSSRSTRDDHRARLRVPDRDDLSRQAARLPDRRGADHLRRPHRRARRR